MGIGSSSTSAHTEAKMKRGTIVWINLEDIAPPELGKTRPGILAFWGNDGTVSHEDSKNCIRLLGTEVFPAVREMAKEFDLKSPFETNQPVSINYMQGAPEKAAAE